MTHPTLLCPSQLLYQGLDLSAPKSRHSLRLRRRFLPLHQKTRFKLFEARRCTISSAKKIASEPRFLLRRKWVKMVLAAEFPALPSSAVKIASDLRCAILVHSGLHVHVSRVPVSSTLGLWQLPSVSGSSAWGWRRRGRSGILHSCSKLQSFALNCPPGELLWGPK